MEEERWGYRVVREEGKGKHVSGRIKEEKKKKVETKIPQRERRIKKA